MDVFSNLILGFSVALSVANLFYCLVGVLLGTFIGVLPGVGPLVTIAVLLPVTFGMPADGAIIMLAGIYYGSTYGGSTTSILVNLPGESSSAVTCIDGYQMAKQGRAGPALAIAAIGSLVAGCFGTLLIALTGPLLASVAQSFGSYEYFSIMLMALLAATAMSSGSVYGGLGMTLLGVLFGLVGTDINTGVSRYTFGIPQFNSGIDFAVMAVGLFALAEIISNLGDPDPEANVVTSRITGLMPTRADLKASWRPILRGTGIGTFFGVLPGVGATIASFASYMVEKRVSKEPWRFGKGAIEGVAGPESANNAAAQTAFIPALTLGVPGGATMAVMLGALMVQGVSPGPLMLTRHAELFWGLVASMFIGNAMLVIINLPLVGLWVTMLRIPYRWLFPIILSFSCIGIYSVGMDPISVMAAAAIGVFGYIFMRLDCSPGPFILGFVLGPMVEENFRRSMILARGDLTMFLTRPISAAFLALGLMIVVLALVPSFNRTREAALADGDG